MQLSPILVLLPRIRGNYQQRGTYFGGYPGFVLMIQSFWAD